MTTQDPAFEVVEALVQNDKLQAIIRFGVKQFDEDDLNDYHKYLQTRLDTIMSFDDYQEMTHS